MYIRYNKQINKIPCVRFRLKKKGSYDAPSNINRAIRPEITILAHI